MKNGRFLLLLTGLLLLVASTITIAGENDYGVQPGDILSISVWKEDGLQQDVLVRPDGGISFPLVGAIHAQGRSIDDLSKQISKRIEKFLSDPVVTVSLRQNLGNRIYVIGKVNKPGEFLLSRYIDVIQALSMAGGMNPFADGNGIQILRRENGKQKAILFSYEAVENGDLKQNIILQPGDAVLVP